MHPSHRPVRGQQQRVRHYASNADSYAMFNLLTGPQLFDRVEASLPVHRDRLFPPTETLPIFLAQTLSADGSCRQVVNDAMVKRVLGGLKPGSTDTGDYCKARSRLPVGMVSTLARILPTLDCARPRRLARPLSAPLDPGPGDEGYAPGLRSLWLTVAHTICPRFLPAQKKARTRR